MRKDLPYSNHLKSHDAFKASFFFFFHDRKTKCKLGMTNFKDK